MGGGVKGSRVSGMGFAFFWLLDSGFLILGSRMNSQLFGRAVADVGRRDQGAQAGGQREVPVADQGGEVISMAGAVAAKICFDPFCFPE